MEDSEKQTSKHAGNKGPGTLAGRRERDSNLCAPGQEWAGGSSTWQSVLEDREQ